jgi:hypothetical protein
LIYFMLTGRSPFRAETTMGVLNRIGNDAPRSIRSINAGVPEWLEQVVIKLLSKPADDRFQTAAEVSKLLQHWHAHLQQPESVKPPQSGHAPLASGSGSRSRVFTWLMAAAAFGFLFFGGVIITLELNKGTLTIESELDNVPIRIMQGNKLIDQMVVSKTNTSVRVAAGKYVVEIDAEFDGIEVVGETISLSRGGNKTVKVVRSVVENMQDENPGSKIASQTFADPLGRTPAQPAPSLTLAEVVEQFNAKMTAADGDFSPQPPLTVDELVCCCGWYPRMADHVSTEANELRTAIGIGRLWPQKWTIEGGKTKLVTNDGNVDVYRIQLVSSYSDTKITVRERFLSPPVKFQEPRLVGSDEAGTPLEAAIAEFNAMHKHVDGKQQQQLTKDEVLAAIVAWNSKRNEATVDNKTFANFQRIAATHQLPADTKFEVISKFQNEGGDVASIWSVRILMPQVARPEWTYAFTIREQHVSLDWFQASGIHWGQPNEQGLQAGAVDSSRAMYPADTEAVLAPSPLTGSWRVTDVSDTESDGKKYVPPENMVLTFGEITMTWMTEPEPVTRCVFRRLSDNKLEFIWIGQEPDREPTKMVYDFTMTSVADLELSGDGIFYLHKMTDEEVRSTYVSETARVDTKINYGSVTSEVVGTHIRLIQRDGFLETISWPDDLTVLRKDKTDAIKDIRRGLLLRSVDDQKIEFGMHGHVTTMAERQRIVKTVADAYREKIKQNRSETSRKLVNLLREAHAKVMKDREAAEAGHRQLLLNDEKDDQKLKASVQNLRRINELLSELSDKLLKFAVPAVSGSLEISLNRAKHPRSVRQQNLPAPTP